MYSIGRGTVISPRAKIVGLDGKEPKHFSIGDYSYVGDDVQIICDHVEIGDYCRIHHHTNIHGLGKFLMGHNAWVGQYSILDATGGFTAGDNCGIGAHSQLWSHIRYGDTLEGCRFESVVPLTVGKDCWFVGHCIVSPIVAEDKSMALVGSVVTRNMLANHIYGGSPAVDLTAKIGPQFAEVTIEDKLRKMHDYLRDFGNPSDLAIVQTVEEFKDDGKSYFAVATRQYTKRHRDSEIAFMKYLLPTKAKFTPVA